MIKNFEIFEDFRKELDPYDEEEWEEPSDFEIGDIVICIEGQGSYLIKGQEYECINIYEDEENIWYVDVQRNGHLYDGWLKTRFRKKK